MGNMVSLRSRHVATPTVPLAKGTASPQDLEETGPSATIPAKHKDDGASQPGPWPDAWTSCLTAHSYLFIARVTAPTAR